MSDYGKNPGANTRERGTHGGYFYEHTNIGNPMPEYTPYIPGLPGSGPGVVGGASQSQQFLKTDQTGIAYDLISEGPIEG